MSEDVLDQIVIFQKKLKKYSASNETEKLLYYIHKLKHLNIEVSHLEITGIGRSVNILRQNNRGIVADKAKALVNKWKDMVNKEEEEEEVEVPEEEEEHHATNNTDQGYTREDEEAGDSGGGGDDDVDDEDEEEEDRLQIQEDQDSTRDYPDTTRDYQDNHTHHEEYNPSENTADQPSYTYQPTQRDQINSESEGEGDSYDPRTSLNCYTTDTGQSSAKEYNPTRMESPEPIPSPSYEDTKRTESHDRKNGSSSSKSKKSSKGEKERSKDKEKHKDRGREKDAHKESSSHEKERKKDHKHKHREREEKREDKKEEKREEKSKSHKDKHKDKERHSDKGKESKHAHEKPAEVPVTKVNKPNESYVANGFSSPESEETTHSTKKEVRESDKRGMNEKRKEKSDRSSSNSSSNNSHKKHSKDSSSSGVHREVRLSDRERTPKENGKERDNSSSSNSAEKDKEKRKKDKHRDQEKSHSDRDKKEKSKDSERKKHTDNSESSKKDSKTKKKNTVADDAGFGAALLGIESPTKKKKKKKRKEAERERDSSDDEKPSTSSSRNKRDLSDDDEELQHPKKPKLLSHIPQRLPKLPDVIPDEKPFLPEITPNYKPLPRVAMRDDPASRMTEEEALNFMFQSRNKRSKVYSGKVAGLSSVPRLFDSCIKVLQDNVDSLVITCPTSFDVIKPVLERASPQTLLKLEDYNSFLLEDTHILWESHCKKDFRSKKREEMETYRELWLRCYEEREVKLKYLTQNLQQKFVSKAEPKRMTKLAFVGSDIKVPKNVARAQAKYGTAPSPSVVAKSAKAIVELSASDMKANEQAARKIAMQNSIQNVQRQERTPSNRPSLGKKKKVAPMMAKTRQFFKKAFRR